MCAKCEEELDLEDMQHTQDVILEIVEDLNLTADDVFDMKKAIIDKYAAGHYDFIETLHALSAMNDYELGDN